MAYSYQILKLTHMEHHKHTNTPELDPDHEFNNGATLWDTIKINIQSFQPDSNPAPLIADCLERLGTPEAKNAYLTQIAILVAHMTYCSFAPPMVMHWKRCFYGGCR